MSAPENKVRVFFSSTFRDMHAERDHLVTVVFPELRERCERLGLEFFDVDLRWGVPGPQTCAVRDCRNTEKVIHQREYAAARGELLSEGGEHVVVRDCVLIP